jgi:LacI family transcriptional regulator
MLNADTFAIQAVASLIAQGHQRIALVSNAPSHGEKEYLISSVRERIDGYRAALHDANMLTW